MSASNRYLVIKPLPEEELAINKDFNKLVSVGQIVIIKEGFLKTINIKTIDEMGMMFNEMNSCFKQMP